MSLFILMTLTNMIFMFMFHPLAMILILILQSVFIASTIFMFIQFPWFSYTLILVFLGGMLILFMYMSNIASNEMFKPNYKLAMIFFITPLIEFMFNAFPQNFSKETYILMTNEFSNMMIFKPYSISIFSITTIMAIYIILTLLTVVKISKMDQGPLRII